MAIKNLQRAFSILLLTMMVMGIVQPGSVQAGPPADLAAQAEAKIEGLVLEEIATSGTTDFFVWMTEKADLSPAEQLQSKQAKGQFVYETLVATAERTQKNLRAFLDGQGVDYEAFYIANKVLVRGGGLELAMMIVGLPDVAKITANHQYQLDVPYMNPAGPEGPTVVEANITFINADDVWAMGYTGQGTVMAGNDTGLDETHPTIARHYRGCLNPPTCTSWDHNYNWWDATGTYPTDPYDGYGHGTHTTGTMVGDDGGTNQIGEAPGAQTVHCKNMTDGGSGSDATFTECFEWDLAPWDLSGANPTPALAPDAINNSWGYGGGGQNQFRDEIIALQAAGIAVEVSAGNEGSSCASLRSPGDYQEVLTTGSVNHANPYPGTITGFSSRGPSDLDGNYFPDIMAPGENVRSALPGNSYGSWSGTSMAGPHATALVGLIWSACPAMTGMVDQTFQIIKDTAAPLTGQGGSNCGGDYNTGPNNDWGMGTIDALAAVQYAIGMCSGVGQLDGTVTDAVTTDPIEGVSVTAEWSGGGLWMETTDVTGYYTFTTVPAGDYAVTFEHPMYTTLVANTVVETDTLTTLDVDLTPRGLLFGYVTDADNGFALEGATVEADDGTVAMTDADGYYEMYLDEGTYDVTASMQDYAPETATVNIVSGGTTQQDFALLAAVTFVPMPVHVYLDWGATGTLPATLTNRLPDDYDFEFMELPVGFIPILGEGVEYEMAPSIPADLTTGLAPEGYEPTPGVSGGIPEGPWQSRTSTPFATMDNVYVDYEGMGYLVGGYGGAGQVGIYDPDTNSWSTGAVEPSPQIAYTVDACLGQNASGEGVIVLFNDTSSGAPTLHRYNIATNTWDTPSVPSGFPSNGLWAHDTVSLLRFSGQNVCYISGGATAPGGGNTSALYEYHPDTNTVVNLGNFNYLSGGFAFHASWFVPWIGTSGAICVAGGVNASSVVSSATQCYDIGAGVFNAANADLGAMPAGVWGMAEDVLYEGGDYQLWLANGADAAFALWPNSAYYSLNDGAWHIGPTPPTTVYRVEGTNIAAADGCSFYVAAGSTGGFSPSTGHNRNYSAECPPTVGVEVPWLGEDPLMGTVPADDSLPVTLLFTATVDVGVNQPGDYLATLKVSGDPALDVPVTMTVNPPANMGKVTGLVWDNCLDVPLEKVLVSILGGDPITETETDENGEYTAWLYEGMYTLEFSLDDYVTFSADVTIVAGETVVLDVALVPDRPCMQTSPDMIEVWVLTDTAVYTFAGGLDLINNGNQPNDFELVEVPGEYFTTTGGAEIDRWVTFPAMQSPEGTAAAQGPAVPERSFRMPSVVPLAGPNVLLVNADTDGGGTSPIQLMLQAYGDLGLVDLFDARYATPTLAQLLAYDVVVTWSNYVYADPTGMGNVLADYIDAGGKVVDLMFAMGTHGWQMSGRFMVENYTAINGTGILYSNSCLGTYDPGHPIMEGITTVCDLYRLSGSYLTPDSTAIALWQDGQLFVGVKDNQTVVSIAGYVGSAYQWTGQMDDVLHNAILWLTSAQADVEWFWEVPITGTVGGLSTENIGIYFTSQYTDGTPMPLGTYTAELIVKNDDSVSDDPTLTVTMHIIEDYVLPQASFEADAEVCEDVELAFTNTTIVGVPPATDYLWDFGDGNTSTEENPMHAFADSGTYIVTLQACNVAGCTEFSQPVDVIANPEASFTFVADWLEVTFTNTSLNGDTYMWDFGDGVTSTEEAPVHVYTDAGSYTTTLTVYNECGLSMFEALVTVEACPEAEASFTFETNFLEVTFTNTSVNGISYEWDFGDGIISTEENPMHVYAEGGTYTVTLTVYGECNMAVFEAVVTVEEGVFFYVLPLQYKNTP